MAAGIDTIEISEATVADTADVIRLFGKLHRYNEDLDPRFALADDWEQLVATYVQQSDHSGESIWLLARAGVQAIGFVLVEVHYDSPLYKYRRWAEIVGLYVDPEQRGSEAAHLLMQHAYAWAQGHHLAIMQLYVTASNERAQRFYRRQGFSTSQLILRRTLPTDSSAIEATTHAAERLHFSEGGIRPLDMHTHKE
jgi:ribosomal protein S18 acetylase RimI-like enzyme